MMMWEREKKNLALQGLTGYNKFDFILRKSVIHWTILSRVLYNPIVVLFVLTILDTLWKVDWNEGKNGGVSFNIGWRVM